MPAERPFISPSDLRVATFNVRYSKAADGPNRWGLRCRAVIETIRRIAPDLLGLQEVLNGQRVYLDAELAGYRSIGVGRDDGAAGGEMTPIYFRAERFELIDSGHFWLSEHPGRPSIGWDARHPRLVTWAELRDRLAGPSLRVLNTHLDFRGGEARLRSVEMILESLKETPDQATVVTGDFNCGEGSAPHRKLFEDPRMRDAFRRAHPRPLEEEGTRHDFDPENTRGERIDWIAVSAGLEVRDAWIDRHRPGERMPSDHFPVVADLVVPTS